MNDFKKLVRPFETLVFWLVLTLIFHSIVVRAFLVKKFFSGKSPSKTWVRLVRRCVLYAVKCTLDQGKVGELGEKYLRSRKSRGIK